MEMLVWVKVKFTVQKYVVVVVCDTLLVINVDLKTFLIDYYDQIVLQV